MGIVRTGLVLLHSIQKISNHSAIFAQVIGIIARTSRRYIDGEKNGIGNVCAVSFVRVCVRMLH